MVNIYFKTFGCSTNFSETEVMKGLLDQAEFKIVNNIEDAFVIIINICTVKGNAKALREIKSIKEQYPNKKLIVAGCITKDIIPKIKEIKEDTSLVSTHNATDIVSVVEETINDNPVAELGKTGKVNINFPKIRKNKLISIIPISHGCNQSCSYCSVRLMKGNLKSYPEENIIKEVKQSVNDKCREIWITSQDTAAYMTEKGKSKLPELLKKIISVPGVGLVRLGMANPNHVMPIIDELLEVYKSPKMFKFIHIPVQSGNNEILESMNRKYTVNDFRKLVKIIREKIPLMTISTDIICGYPGETNEQFEDSLSLIKEIKPDAVNRSGFVVRPGTTAARSSKQLNGREVRERTRALTQCFQWIGLDANRRWKNWTGDVLIDEKGKDNTMIGRNLCYKKVIIPNNNVQIGDLIKAKITDISAHYLIGEVIE